MKAQTQRRLRQYHHYVGVFFAPALLLFSVSGILQTFRIPDQQTSANWIAWIAAFHKDQAPPRVRPLHPEGPPPGAKKDQDGGAPAPRPSPLPLKIFVTLMALGLIVSTLLGLTIALNNRAMRRTTLLLMLAGAVLPCVLLWV